MVFMPKFNGDKFLLYWLILLLLVLIAIVSISCSEPGQKYKIEITSINPPKLGGSPYCTYHFKTLVTLIPPRPYFLDDCGKYKVGDVISIEMNDNQ